MPRLHPARLTLVIAAVLVAILALHYAGVGPEWPAWAEHLYEALESTHAVLLMSYP